MLFAISITGLALTASTMWLGGAFYGFLSILHAITVIGALLYLPFGKFFHIFQRPAQLGVKLYQDHGRAGRGGASARRCGGVTRRRCRSTIFDASCRSLVSTTASKVPREPGRASVPACKRTSLATAQLQDEGSTPVAKPPLPIDVIWPTRMVRT